MLSRVTFVTLIAAGIAARVAGSRSMIAAPRIDGTSYTALGARYLHDFPHEADETSLRRHIFGNRTASATAMRRIACERATHDFAHANVVVVDGWLLSRSEARICALAHLGMPHAG
jgi:hypothetical protein